MARIKPDPRNARLHPERNKKMIRDSLEEVGGGRSILIGGEGHIIAGNGVYEQAQALGLTIREVEAAPNELIAVVRPDLVGEAAIRAALLDNATGETSTWDVEALRQLEAEMPSILAGLDEVQAELAAALDALPEPGAGGDEFDTTPDEGPTRAQPGDLWIIGGAHRLIVGDCTDPATVARLMQGERAETTLSDPPYNVGISYGTSTDDNRDDYAAFSRKWFSLCPSDCIVFTPGTVNLTLWCVIQKPKWVCVWRKTNQASPSGLQGFNTWEPLIVYGKQPKPVGQDSWDIPVKQEMDKDNPEHPVAKTVAAWQTFLEAFSTDTALIYDPFLGSGTTLIAAHRTGRRCYGCEIEPRYADVILRRAEAEGLTVERA